MRHFVRQHRGDLGAVVGEREQSAGDIELAVGQCEGVDRRRIEDGEVVAHVLLLGGRDQPLDDPPDRGFERRVTIGAAIRGEDALVLALRRGRLGRPGRLRDRRGPVARGGGEAAGQDRARQDERQQRRSRRFAPADSLLVRSACHVPPVSFAPRPRSAPGSPLRRADRRVPRSSPGPGSGGRPVCPAPDLQP